MELTCKVAVEIELEIIHVFDVVEVRVSEDIVSVGVQQVED